jgi:integrase/recombinase XerC/integrase/recombinase XerD
MYLKECFDLFIESRDSYCSDVTVNNYSNTLGYFFDYLVGVYGGSIDSIDVEDVSLSDLNQYSIYLKNKVRHSNNPYFKGNSFSKISSRTRKDYLKDMCTFFNFLYDMDYIDDNPGVRFKFPKVLPQPIEPLTSDEVVSIDGCFNSLTRLGARNLAFIHMLLDEGMRSGEVQRLKVKDVNFIEDYIVIRNSKGGKGRMLPLASNVKNYINSYFDIVGRPDGDSYVFQTNKGFQLSENAIKCVFQRLKSKSGVSRIYPHLLRHTFATSFILGGGSVEVLRIYMGHSSIETTQKYLHLANNMRFMKNIYQLDECFLKKFY